MTKPIIVVKMPSCKLLYINVGTFKGLLESSIIVYALVAVYTVYILFSFCDIQISRLDTYVQCLHTYVIL